MNLPYYALEEKKDHSKTIVRMLVHGKMYLLKRWTDACVMPEYNFYALYEKGFRKIDPFQKILHSI